MIDQVTLLQRIRDCFINLLGVDEIRELAEEALESVAPLQISAAMKGLLSVPSLWKLDK